MNLTTNNDEKYSNFLFICPEFINLVCFVSGISGMYRSIEIGHPVYAVLFTNISAALLSSVINIANFYFVEIELFIRLSNAW